MKTRPTRVAVVGCGYWGRNLVRTFARLGVLDSVCDTDHRAAEVIAAEHGVISRPFEDVADDPGVNAVAIASPAATHAQLAEQSLMAGKDVLVEKPLALLVADGERVVAAAHAGGRVLMVGHLMRYHPAFVELAKRVEEGALGTLRYLYSNRLNLGRFRIEENALWSFAPHDISMILALVGSEPTDVHAVGGAYLGADVADVTTTQLAFPEGQRGHVFVSWLHPYKEQKLVVVGSSGMAVLDDGQPWESKLVHYDQQVAWPEGTPAPAKVEGVAVPVEPEEPLLRECRHFLDCIESRRTPITDGQEGLRVVRTLERAQASLMGLPT